MEIKKTYGKRVYMSVMGQINLLKDKIESILVLIYISFNKLLI